MDGAERRLRSSFVIPPPAPADILSLVPALRRYARSLTRHAADAEDLVQEALLRAHEGRAGFRPDGALRPWLFAVLRNTFVSVWRSRRIAAEREGQAAGLPSVLVDPPQEDRVRLLQLRDAFLGLPEEQRGVFHLVAIEGLSYGEAAEALGVPVGTVTSRLARARAALRAFEAEARPRSAAHRLRVVGGRDDGAA